MSSSRRSHSNCCECSRYQVSLGEAEVERGVEQLHGSAVVVVLNCCAEQLGGPEAELTAPE